MKTVIVFDIDGTLTPPRQPIKKEMVEILNNLKIPFYVAAGSDMELLEEQFFIPLEKYGFINNFEAFISNGAIHYHCDYSNGCNLNLSSGFKFKNHLGNSSYHFLCDTLKKTLSIEKFKLPKEIQIFENRIKDRSSMINFCPIGRKKTENKSAKSNRNKFVEFDKKTGFREGALNYLREKLINLIIQKDLHITLGGQTSFDIGVKGEDKTKPIRELVEKGFQEIVFIGDALYEGGNDAAINDYIKNWDNKEVRCPVKALQVNSKSDDIDNSWKETIAILKMNSWIKS